ncbi:hypothetical protein LshimejAT787_0501510 [Lyophyllum shimeji]|uniref:Uncharacterized protein n=1 Tax=Lyophyllum shimeji TaxID=47721 RepID=A0A9P3PMA5_LYOSH|nr:hypothetical protein LshimejAT787_0501510 [Lyophyllum shimeji]
MTYPGSTFQLILLDSSRKLELQRPHRQLLSLTGDALCLDISVETYVGAFATLSYQSTLYSLERSSPRRSVVSCKEPNLTLRY